MPAAFRLFLPLLCILAACAGPGRHERPAARHDARAEALRDGACRPPRAEALSVSLQSWVVAGETLPVSLAFPAGSERGLPLIVYLPGLGESAQAGAALRQAWARAGYAVLSVQPLAADERAWSSELARSADFKALARERRQASQGDARMAVLKAVLDEARRRAAGGDSLWQRVDFDKLGLAGAELGAQAALAAPGTSARLAIGPLEPHATDGQPLLVIASRRDSDPLTGAPLAPPARELVEAPTRGDRFLLMFNEVSHAGLSGQAAAAEPQEQQQQQRGEQASRGGGGKHGGGGGRGGGGQRGGGPQMSGGSPGGAMPGRGIQGEGESPAIAIAATSTAFWDATLRASPDARAWLKREASQWLRGLADWQEVDR